MNSSDYILIATALILLFTSLVMLRNNHIGKKASTIQKEGFGIQLFNNLMNEYRSDEMKEAVRGLYTYSQNYEEENLINMFIMNFTDKNKIWDGYRRKVSTFYQYMGNLYALGWIPGAVIYSTFSEHDLRIIKNIIIPLDTKALPRLRGEDDVKPEAYHQSFKNMLKLYEDSKKIK